MNTSFLCRVEASYGPSVASEVKKEINQGQIAHQSQVAILSKVLALHSNSGNCQLASEPFTSETVPMTFDPKKRRIL